MSNLKFIEISEDIFKKLENNYNNSNYYQSVSWAYLKELTGWKKKYVAVYDGIEYKAISLLLYKSIIFNRNIFYAPRGILANYDDYNVLKFFTYNIKNYIKRNNGFLFMIDPLVKYCDRDINGEVIGNINDELVHYLKNLGYIHKGFTTDYNVEIQFRWSFYKNSDDIMKNMDKRCKRSLRKSDKYPCVVKEVDDNSILDFKAIMEHTCERHECFDRSLNYYKRIKEVFKERVKIIVVYLNRNKYLSEFKDDKLYDKIMLDNRKYIPVTAGVFFIDNNSVHYVYGGTFKEYMSFNFQYKLQYLMIEYAKNNNISIYDFGGISGNFDKDSLYYGIYEFKRGFGGYVVEYIGEFDLIINMPLYICYKFMYKIYSILKRIYLKIKN